MPELAEVERYRLLAQGVVGRRICAVEILDPRYLRAGEPEELCGALVATTVEAVRRRGKLLLVDTSGPAVLGLRFGMTGHLRVDGVAGVERLLHAPAPRDGAYLRVELRFAGGGRLGVEDPRRLGSVELDPDEARLGPDALRLGAAQLRAALAGSSGPLKARLLDQARVAGLGNLSADEILWRVGLSPLRPAGALDPSELLCLQQGIRRGLRLLLARGGSHTGDLAQQRRPGGRCPRDGAPLRRDRVGGRTTWWCPAHQH